MKPLVIAFYHGRHTPDEDLPDWGFNGPSVQIDWYSSTYNSHLRFGCDEGDEADIRFVEDLVHIPGVGYFGDFTIFATAALTPHDQSTTLTIAQFCELCLHGRTIESFCSAPDYQI